MNHAHLGDRRDVPRGRGLRVVVSVRGCTIGDTIGVLFHWGRLGGG